MSVQAPKWRTCLIAHALVLLATAAVAQDPESSYASVLPVGSRVRLVSTTVQSRLKGIVVAIDDKQLTLAPEDRPPMKIAVSSISTMELSVGRKRHWLRGLGIGAASGALLGIGALGVPGEHRVERDIGFTAVGGALIGAGIGALFKSDQWAPVRVGGRPPSTGRRSGVSVTALRF